MNEGHTLTRQPQGKVIAVMVVWNGLQFLELSVSSVLEVLGGEDDLLIVENGSTDGSFELLCQQFPQVAVLQTHENLGGAGGFNAGINVALESSDCRYIWLLDNDILVEKGALKPLLDVLQGMPKVGAAGSQICLYDHPDTVQEIGAHFSPWLGSLQQYRSGGSRLDPDHAPVQVDYLAACSLMVKVEVFHDVGVFPDFFIFYDDVEWGLRAGHAGWELWAVPASVIRHNFSGLKPTILWREYYRKRNRLACLAMHPPEKGKWLAVFIYLVFLNFIILTHRLGGNQALSRVYALALSDLLCGRLGKRDLSTLAIPSLGQVPPDVCQVDAIWLDMAAINLGDALAIAAAIRSVSPGTVCYLPEKAGFSKMLQGIEGLSLVLRPKKRGVAVVGELYSFSAAIMPKVYRVRNGDFTIIKRPLVEYIWSRLRRAIALVYGVVVTPYQGMKLRNVLPQLLSQAEIAPNRFIR